MLRQSEVQRRGRQGRDHESSNTDNSLESITELTSFNSGKDAKVTVAEGFSPESLGLQPLEEDSPLASTLAATDRFIRARTESTLDETDTPVSSSMARRCCISDILTYPCDDDFRFSKLSWIALKMKWKHMLTRMWFL